MGFASRCPSQLVGSFSHRKGNLQIPIPQPDRVWERALTGMVHISDKPDLSIVIPAYNEAERLPAAIDSMLAYFDGQGTSFELIVVDDGSTDRTGEVVMSYREHNSNLRLILIPENRGKGHAVRTGMLSATGALRLYADADGATPVVEYARLERAVSNGADLAIGSRALKADDCVIQAHLHRKVMGSIFNTLVRMLVVGGISDTQCGFKLFTARAADMIFPRQRLDGFCFDVELLVIAELNGFRVAEVPVNWADVPGGKVRLFRDSCIMFAELLRIRLNSFRGAYAS